MYFAALDRLTSILEQLAVNPWRSPQRVSNAHLANELTNVQGRLWLVPHDRDVQHQYARKPARCRDRRAGQ
jgi:hypothetical protein